MNWKTIIGAFVLLLLVGFITAEAIGVDVVKVVYDKLTADASAKGITTDEYASNQLESQIVKEMKLDISNKCDELTNSNDPTELQKRIDYINSYSGKI